MTRPPLFSTASLVLCGLGLLGVVNMACTSVRYTESFVPEGEIHRIVVRSDAGLVELVGSQELRVQRQIRAPESALALSHDVVDGVLVLDAHCTSFLPCAVDIRVDLPAGIPVEVDLGQGQVRGSGLSDLALELDEGEALVELSGDLRASIGAGSLSARLSHEAQARVGVGQGDIEIEVLSGSWDVDADTERLQLIGMESEDDGGGSLELTAPAGTVVVRGAAGVASR